MGRIVALGLGLAAVLAALGGGSSVVHARKPWPHPAAGASRSGDPEVFFTFDDGPDPRWTGKILDVLARYHVQAAFFWVGHRVAALREAGAHGVIPRAIDEGHLIGNHTFDHAHLCHRDVDAAHQIDRNRDLFERLAGFPVLLFRAPYGDHCPRVVEMLEKRGLHHLHWDVDPHEYYSHSAEATAGRIISHLRHLRGRAVVLMHDTQGATLHALPIILKWIEDENQRRAARGRRPIRVLPVADLVEEQRGAPTLWLWAGDALGMGQRRLVRAIGELMPGAVVPPALSLRVQ